jgi:hypothetical protein
MNRRALGRRVSTVRAHLNPQPETTFLANARAVIEFGGKEWTAESMLQLARHLARGHCES